MNCLISYFTFRKSPTSRTVAIPPEFATYPKVYKCRRCPHKCEDTYATLELLREHFVIHMQDKNVPKRKNASNFPCVSPSGEATEEDAIQRMAKVLISCPECKKMFFPGRLVQHLRTAHVRVLCDECGGMFSRVAMWEHKKAHKFKAEGKKPYKCDKCDKEFLWQVGSIFCMSAPQSKNAVCVFHIISNLLSLTLEYFQRN